jgi:general secretion pathway protein M
MLQRLNELSSREKLASVGCSIVVLLYGGYLLFYQPMAAESILLQQKVRSQGLAYQHLQRVGAEVAALRRQGLGVTPEPEVENQSPMAVVDGSSQQLEIKPFIKRLQPEGTDKVTLWLEDVAFDKLVYWLAILEDKHRLTVIQADVDKQAVGEGLVNAKILLGG